MFRVTKLGCYVIVDVDGNRVTFRALDVRINIKKKKKTPRIVSLGRLWGVLSNQTQGEIPLYIHVTF